MPGAVSLQGRHDSERVTRHRHGGEGEARVTGGRWTPERMAVMGLLVLTGIGSLVAGLELPNASLWIAGVGAIAVWAMFLLYQIGAGRMVQLVTALVILAGGIGWPLLTARNHTDLESNNVRWTSAASSGPQMNVSGDRVYTHGVRGTVVLDRATGEERWRFQEANDQGYQAFWLRASENGSVLFMYVDDTMVYVSPTGRELWRMAGDDDVDTRVMPYAIAGDTVAIGECLPPAPGTPMLPCRFFGMHPNGELAWEREGYPLAWGGSEGLLAGFGNAERMFIDDMSPYVLMRERQDADADVLVLDAATGEEVERLPAADLMVPVGDLVLASERSGAGGSCALRAVRPGEVAWEIGEMPCITDPYVTGSRLYAATEGDSAVTVSLEDGAWRDVGQVGLRNAEVTEWRAMDGPVVVPMEQTIASFDGRELRVADAATGDPLWNAVMPTGINSQPWIVTMGHDTIAVTYRTDPGPNPFIAGERQERGLMIVGYDGMTGDEIGRMPSSTGTLSWLLSSESAVAPAAPGEVYVMGMDYRVERFGRP